MQELPELSMPASISLLVSSNRDVPSKYLLNDLQWESLLNGPLMEQDEYQYLRQSILKEHTRLTALCENGADVASEYCRELFKKFNSWLGAHVDHVSPGS